MQRRAKTLLTKGRSFSRGLEELETRVLFSSTMQFGLSQFQGALSRTPLYISPSALSHSSQLSASQIQGPLTTVQLSATVAAAASSARPLGVDVSNNNGTIDWSYLANPSQGNIQFAWAKASEGTGFTDTFFSGNMSSASALGIKIGAYHYARYDLHPGTSGADSEAAFFWSKIKSYYTTGNTGKYLMPMLDVEQATSQTQAQVSAWVNEFCNDIAASGAAQSVTLIPVVYSYTSYAKSYLDSTVAESWSLNMAYYGTNSFTQTDAQTGAPSSITPWQQGNSGAWSFWQYSSTLKYNGQTIDSDVFDGTINDLNELVLGETPWPANSRVITNATVTDWNSVQATASYGSVASGVSGTIVGPFGYGNSYYRFEVRWDTAQNGSSTGWVAGYFLDTLNPSAPTTPTPSNTTASWVKTPSSLSWHAGTNDVTYNVYVDGALKASGITATSYAPGTLSDGTHTWRVDANNAELTTTGATWSFKSDGTAPTAIYGAQTATAGSSTLTFTVTYSDASSGVKVSTLDNSDITVTGPNSFSQNATFVSVDNNTNGTPRVATYQISAPNGIWNAKANGTYIVKQNVGQVTDVAGNTRAAGTISTFAVNLPVAYVSGGALIIDSTASGSTITINPSGSNIIVTEGASTVTITAGTFSTVMINGSSGNDTYNVNASLGAPLAINGSGGNDQLNVSGGSVTIASDLSAGGTTMAAFVSNGGYLGFNSTQHLAGGLNIGPMATAEVVAGHDKVLVVPGLAIDSTGRLQLQDNAMIVDYQPGASPIVSIQQYLASSFDGGNWDMPGIASAAAGGSNYLTTLGYAEASDLGINSFDNQGVDTSAIIIKYTYYGDVNLDGAVNQSDYSIFIGGLNGQGSGWAHGDLNYDAAINLDDFSIFIDGFNLSGPPL